jgi:Glycogen recognition site of AMP-activated protein kinase
MKTLILCTAALALALAPFACSNQELANGAYMPPGGEGGFTPGYGGFGTGTGTGAAVVSYGGHGGTGGTPLPVCPDTLKLCAETFTYPYNGETSVELRGDYAAGAWQMGNPMTQSGSVWAVTVPVPWSTPVQYKFFVNGTTWETDPNNPPPANDPNNPNGNSIDPPITCPTTYTCAMPSVPPAGVFDWRDAIIYFVFVDRFLDGDP